MYAIIKNNQIIGGASDIETAQWSASSNDGVTYVSAPDDFTVYGFKFVGGAVVKKTAQDDERDSELADVLSHRKNAYPPIGDQLDALWKGGDEAADMLARVQAVKQRFPKPE